MVPNRTENASNHYQELWAVGTNGTLPSTGALAITQCIDFIRATRFKCVCFSHMEGLAYNKTRWLDFIVITMCCQGNIDNFVRVVWLSDPSVHWEWGEEWGHAFCSLQCGKRECYCVGCFGTVGSNCLTMYSTLHITKFFLTLMRNIMTRIISMPM